MKRIFFMISFQTYRNYFWMREFFGQSPFSFLRFFLFFFFFGFPSKGSFSRFFSFRVFQWCFFLPFWFFGFWPFSAFLPSRFCFLHFFPKVSLSTFFLTPF